MTFAHVGWHGVAIAAWRHWTFEPLTVALLLVSAAVYARGLGNLWRRAGHGAGIRVWEAASFGAGLVCLAAALLSPLAWLSTILFSAHMTQHELLMLVAAPLLVFGQPLFAVFWAVPPRRRERCGRWIRRTEVQTAWHLLTGPSAVFALQAFVLWVWHVPVLFNAALADDNVHALQHFTFVLAASLFWWGMVAGRYGRAGYGIGVFYVFVTALHSSVLGALMTIAPSVWYEPYIAAGASWHIDPLVDQQLAGLLMWIPSGLIFIVFGLALLAAWLGESERRVQLGSVYRGAGDREPSPPREPASRTSRA